METLQPTIDQEPPGFAYDSDRLDDYDEQLKAYTAFLRYQDEPVPSFEHVSRAAVIPEFNPTGASEAEIYASSRCPDSFRPKSAPHSELTGDPTPVTMWRIVDRIKLEDGTGLISSRIQTTGELGDVEGFDPMKHFISHDAKRTNDPEASTPFVSFSTDPRQLAEIAILKHGFGVRSGRDSVVVSVRVDPSRVITRGHKKDVETLLLGGVAPEEYQAAYEVTDFVTNVVPEGHTDRPVQDVLEHWKSQPELIDTIRK